MINRLRPLLSIPTPLILLILTLLVLHHRLLLGESFVWALPPLQFYPWRAYAVHLLSIGELPLWNPFNGAGAPLLANYQSALLYPLGWPSFVLPIGPAMSLTAVAHLVITGWGMWKLTGRLGYTPLGRGISVLAFAMTSYLVARLGTFPLISTAAWLPWLCWSALGVLETRRRIDLAWFSAFVALMLLAGHAQTAWYSLMLTGIFALWRAAQQRPFPLTRLLLLAGGVLLGAGASALQLVATGELLLSSQRASGVDYAFAMNFSYAPARFLNFLSPSVFGTPANGSYFTEGAFFEDAVYIGLIPLVSAFAALLYWLRTRRQTDRPAYVRDTPFWTAIIVFALILAMGRYTPIFPFLYERVPTFDLFQAPVRWHLWTVFGLSLLAGAGAAAWTRARRAMRWSNRLTAVSAAALLVGLLAPAALPADDSLADIGVVLQALFTVGLLGVGAGLLSARQPAAGSPQHARWRTAVLMLICLDLGWAAWGLNPTVREDFRFAPGSPNAARGVWSRDGEETVRFDRYFRFNDYRPTAALWPEARASQLANLNLLDGIPLLTNFDPLRPGSMVQVQSLLEDDPQSAPALLQAAHVDRVYDAEGQTVAVGPTLGRAWVVETACLHESAEQVTEAMRSVSWDPSQVVHVLSSQTGDCPDAPDREPAGTVAAIGDELQRVEIQVQTERPAWLVLADTAYPGWRAWVDGEAAPIETANLAFRTVFIPTPGAHSVRFEYAPSWLVPGAVISAASLILLAGLFVIRRRPAES